jgi:hypothetical protein
MTKQELRALAEQAAREKEITHILPGDRALTEREMYLKAHANEREKQEARIEHQLRHPRPARHRQERITIVTDHCGREFYRNEEGEWL